MDTETRVAVNSIITALTNPQPGGGGSVDVSLLAKDTTVAALTHPADTQQIAGMVTVSNLPATQPISGTVTVGNPVTSVAISNLPVTQAISGTVAISNFPATQPVSIATMPSTPVTGTFFQATQPVSISSMPSTPVTGTFFQATQPVSIAGTIATAEDRSTGRTAILKTGTLTSSATTADQVILTYTVTSGKTLYLENINIISRFSAISATATILGAASMETPSGTKGYTMTFVNPTTSESLPVGTTWGEPIPVAAGTVIRVVCTPATSTSIVWIANFSGYEK